MSCPQAAALAALGTWASLQSYWIRGSAKPSPPFFFLNKFVGWFLKFENHLSNVLKYLYLDPLLILIWPLWAGITDIISLSQGFQMFPMCCQGWDPRYMGKWNRWMGPCWVSTLVSLGFLSVGITRDRWLKEEMACPEAFSWGPWPFLCLLSFNLLSAEQHRPVEGDDDFFF